MTRLLLIGPPGAGKGTQAAALGRWFSVPSISTGDIFRFNIENATELGQRVKAFINRGVFVPDELTNEIVRDRLFAGDVDSGFILDGYPRTTQQVEELDRLLASQGTRLDAVVCVTADPDEIVTRLRKRAIEQGRSDDTEEIIRRRLDVYEEQTRPVVDAYSERGLVDTVNGLGAIGEVTDRILAVLGRRAIVPVSKPVSG